MRTALRAFFAVELAVSEAADPTFRPFLWAVAVSSSTGWATARGSINCTELVKNRPAIFTIGIPTGSRMTVTHNTSPTSPSSAATIHNRTPQQSTY